MRRVLLGSLFGLLQRLQRQIIGRIDRYFSYVEKYIQEQAVLYTCIYIKICRQENDRAHRLTRLTFSLLIKFLNQLYFIDSVLSHLSLITSITGKEEDLVGKECVNSS